MAIELNIPEKARGLIIMVVSIVVVLAGGGFGGSKWLAYQNKLIEDMNALDTKIAQHDTAMNSKPRLESEYDDLRDEILEKWDTMKILNPLSGTRIYLENARAIVTKAGTESGVMISGIEGLGEAELPGKAAGFTFNTYGVRLSMAGGYENMRYLLDKLSTDNPYILLSEFSINRSPDPLNNSATVIIRWPVFPDTQEKEKWIAELKKSVEEDKAEAESAKSQESASSAAPGGDNA
jgi:hypothetical protein